MTMTCPSPNKRPIAVTDEMASIAADKVADDLVKYHGMNEDERAVIIADLLQATDCDRHADGYRIARHLDYRCLWTITSALVGALDAFSSYCDGELREAEKQWGIENPMEPPLPLGSTIVTRKGNGILDHISEYSPATYGVKVPSITNGFLLVRFEDARLA